MSRIEDATAALRAFHDAEEVERLARDVMTSALIHRNAVAEAIDCLRGATERREAAYWEALRVFADFGDDVGKPDPPDTYKGSLNAWQAVQGLNECGDGKPDPEQFA